MGPASNPAADALVAVRALMLALDAGDADPYDTAGYVAAAALEGAMEHTRQGQLCTDLYRLWSDLADWVELVPAEEPAAKAAMRRAAAEWLEAEPDEAAQRAYMDRWLRGPALWMGVGEALIRVRGEIGEENRRRLEILPPDVLRTARVDHDTEISWPLADAGAALAALADTGCVLRRLATRSYEGGGIIEVPLIDLSRGATMSAAQARDAALAALKDYDGRRGDWVLVTWH